VLPPVKKIKHKSALGHTIKYLYWRKFRRLHWRLRACNRHVHRPVEGWIVPIATGEHGHAADVGCQHSSAAVNERDNILGTKYLVILGALLNSELLSTYNVGFYQSSANVLLLNVESEAYVHC
jgi:hypothetical protein